MTLLKVTVATIKEIQVYYVATVSPASEYDLPQTFPSLAETWLIARTCLLILFPVSSVFSAISSISSEI